MPGHSPPGSMAESRATELPADVSNSGLAEKSFRDPADETAAGGTEAEAGTAGGPVGDTREGSVGGPEQEGGKSAQEDPQQLLFADLPPLESHDKAAKLLEPKAPLLQPGPLEAFDETGEYYYAAVI